MIILFYGEYIHCQCERGVIQTKIVSICFTKGYVHVYRIAYFPFHSVFRSVPLSVPRFIEIFTLRKHYLHRIHLRFYRGDNVKTPMLSSHSGNIYMIIVTLAEKNSVVRGEAEVYNGFQVVTFSNICHLCAGNNYY